MSVLFFYLRELINLLEGIFSTYLNKRTSMLEFLALHPPVATRLVGLVTDRRDQATPDPILSAESSHHIQSHSIHTLTPGP